MNPLFTTLTIARFEATVLLRSWFLRIVTPLFVIIICLLDYLIFVRPEVPWMLNASASFIPYFNLLLLNVVQSIVGVFLASEFLKDDLKLDITEVIYPHSMTNAEYVLGKMLGIFGVFAALNIVVLVIGLVFNTFFSHLPVSAAAYLWYPLLISLPTLIFVFGLSFLLMLLIRNQALTIILLLGYIVATHLYLGGSYHNLFDYFAFRTPLAYSDFVGFGDLSRVLVHRGIYFLLGLGFILLTVRFLRRLPQSRLVSTLSLVLAVLSLGGAIYLGQVYVGRFSDAESLRARMTQLNAEIRQASSVSLLRCDLALEHRGDAIEVRAGLHVVNNTAGPLASLVFSLNPGLEVIAVEKDGAAVPFERELHLLKVSPPAALAPGERASLTVSYRGRIEEWVCYPEIDAKETGKANRIILYNIDKRYAFVQPDYVLLTPECLWYPRAGLSEGAAWPVVPPLDFIDFTLDVTTAAGLRAISQGEYNEKSPGRFEFRPETPLTHLSLAIGPYEIRSITVTDSAASSDSTTVPTTEYTLYYLKGHDFFLEYFTAADSFLPDLLRSSRAQFETRLGLEYPYRRLSLVETPLQFFAYPRCWRAGAETVQPEMVLLPEKVITLQNADFKRMSYFMNRSVRMGRSQMSATEIQRDMLQQLISLSFLTSSMQSRASGFMNIGGLTSFIQAWDCALLPMYSYYTRHFSSSRWPLINLALEFQWSRQSATEREEMTNVMLRGLSGVSPMERANLALSKRTLDEIISSPAEGEDLQIIMKAKCDYLINLLRCKIGGKEFKAFMDEYCRTHRFTDTGSEVFVGELSKLCNEDLALLLDGWAHETGLPAYTIGSPRQYEVTDGDRTRYQILLTVTNDSETDGVVGVNFVWGKGGSFEQVWGSRPQNPADVRFYEIGAGRCKEIGIVMDAEIHALWIDTGLSGNLPCSKVLHFSTAPAEKGAALFEGEREVGQVSRQDPGIIIVDNEDTGFEIKGSGNQSFLKRFIHRPDSSKQDYVGLLQPKPPARWSKALYGDFYGRHKHSGCYIKAGSGENTACWKADLPRNGNYELCYHTLDLPSRQLWNPGGQKPRIKDFHFKVYDDDGPKEMSVDLDEAGEGWYSLGTFYFSAGEARVELSDQTKGRIVYADAVRWTQRD